MDINVNGEAVRELRKLLEYPPYLIFVFVGAIFVAASLVWQNNFYQVLIFFLYSVIGSIWRYIEKDMLNGIQKLIEKEKNLKICNLIVITIYHIGNAGLVYLLIYYLKLI